VLAEGDEGFSGGEACGVLGPNDDDDDVDDDGYECIGGSNMGFVVCVSVFLFSCLSLSIFNFLECSDEPNSVATQTTSRDGNSQGSIGSLVYET
jgi:hypothetical protein